MKIDKYGSYKKTNLTFKTLNQFYQHVARETLNTY